jgi:hypothetical protein
MELALEQEADDVFPFIDGGQIQLHVRATQR